MPLAKKMSLIEYSDYVSNNYFKCKSPIENDEICLEFAKKYPNTIGISGCAE